MPTIAHNEIHSWWDGKVIIDEIKTFSDDRGLVCELWRSDDMGRMVEQSDLRPQMAYWSLTKPLVMRGPHAHESQTDWFVCWQSRMVYQFYNPETDEMKYFISTADKVYRIKVAPPIIHSYRNTELRIVMTGNFPTALYAGQEKKEAVDEIRHEDKLDHNNVYVILGSEGRLGRALTASFYHHMAMHAYDVIPLSMMIEPSDFDQLEEIFRAVDRVVGGRKVRFINAAALANVQTAQAGTELLWVNSRLPLELAKRCAARGWRFMQFSTDYIYQQDGKLSAYTLSKQEMEADFNEVDNSVRAVSTIIRLSNLFSTDPKDKHHLPGKLKEQITAGQTLKIIPEQTVGLTAVEVLSEFLVDLLINNNQILLGDGFKRVNLVSPPLTLLQLLVDYFKYDRFETVKPELEEWYSRFQQGENADHVFTLPDSHEHILEYISKASN
ncbi:MAG: sugar nucleotide-binding protein [Candidatus Komeilibacteria bacterium]|nr:sugar nucleotide-binding protein [Candidatus Komeilibacteria bacterium]